MDLAVELKQRGYSTNTGVGYYDALVEYITTVASGAQNSNPNASWRSWLELLDANHRELLPRRAYEILEVAGGEVSDEYFILMGETLSNWQLLSNQQRFIDQVCRPILENGNEKGIEWLSNVAQASPELFTQNDDTAAANDFMDRVRQRLADTPEDDAGVFHLKKIAVSLGINPAEIGVSEGVSEISLDAPRPDGD